MENFFQGPFINMALKMIYDIILDRNPVKEKQLAVETSQLRFLSNT